MNTYFTKEERGTTTLLFLHGWGCDGSIFASIANRISATSYLVDLWGFGNSDSPPCEGWTVEQYATQLYQWIVDNDIGVVSIVAHSFGARVAVVLASMHPDIVDKLLIVGGAGLRRFSLVRTVKVLWFKLKKFAVACGLMPQSVLYGSGSVDYGAVCGTAMHNTFVKVISQDLSRYARGIICPTLLVWGKDDTDTPLWMAHRYNKLIVDSQLVLLSGDHFAFLSNSALFANIVSALIEGE